MPKIENIFSCNFSLLQVMTTLPIIILLVSKKEGNKTRGGKIRLCFSYKLYKYYITIKILFVFSLICKHHKLIRDFVFIGYIYR
jgi:hypothetical protein